ncbi:hypothetical protein [Melittangium boletus]|uniref:hypothetical protein n=1 Tax=Melittangium boletus TaxID=83453 RepID=UPI003DA33BD2
MAEVEQGVIVLQGSGNLLDGDDKLTYKVEDLPNGDKSKVRLVLQSADDITWWKSLDIYTTSGTTAGHAYRIETKDKLHEVSKDYPAGEMQSSYRVEFWKAGVFNIGVKVYTLELGRTSTLGKKLTFRWERD